VGDRIEKVVVLGGGTAGWMAAAYLGRAFQGTVDITVLEAPQVPTLGVGEATVPNLQTAFFDFLGVPEDEWMRKCNASYKMAIKFINWRTGGDGVPQPRATTGGSDHFYHTFGLLPYHEGVPLSHYWLWRRERGQESRAFDYACYKEPPAMDLNRSPRWLDGTPATNYAWHFDAHLVAAYLRDFAVERLGVGHVEDLMVEAVRRPDGFIESLRTKSGRVLTGDLFVDCSGFRGLLINQAMAEPFLDMSDHLLCDSAVAVQVPHDDEANGVEPFTSAIAMKSGWTWKIPMPGRFGTGYVFSGKFTERDEATEDFCSLWGLDPESTALNHIRFRVGRNRNAWVRNCVGIGTSSCFVEPLESTGIYFIYAALYQMVKHFPDKDFNETLIGRFNREIATMFDDTRDFIQAHYYFSQRNDTPFWKANKELSLGEGIQEKIALYRTGMAINAPLTDDAHAYYGNFEEEFRNFWNNSNYYCVLAGLGMLPDNVLPRLAHMPEAVAGVGGTFELVEQEQRRLAGTLPSLHAFLVQQHTR
jgi:Tryptophan halogenase